MTWVIEANNGEVDTHEMHVGDVLSEHDARDGDGPDDEDFVLPQLQVVHEATGHGLLDAVNGRLGFLRKPVGATVNIYFSDRRYLIIWRPPLNYLAAAR